MRVTGRDTSWIHLDDAAAATVLALERGQAGIYNIVDDEPAPARDWLPVLAEALGAGKPRRVPAWLIRLAAGEVRGFRPGEDRGVTVRVPFPSPAHCTANWLP